MADIMKMGQNPNYLGSWDLEDVPGCELVLTIEKIVDEQVVANGQKETCTLIHWTDKNYKPMIINITNKKTLCRLYKTKDTEKLKGKSVIVGIEKVKAFGDIHDALRIKKTIPQPPQKALCKCEQCGADIPASFGMTSEQLAAYTKKQYGKSLCGSCAKADKEAKMNDEA